MHLLQLLVLSAGQLQTLLHQFETKLLKASLFKRVLKSLEYLVHVLHWETSDQANFVVILTIEVNNFVESREINHVHLKRKLLFLKNRKVLFKALI
jgi:hypothetical protein